MVIYPSLGKKDILSYQDEMGVTTAKVIDKAMKNNFSPGNISTPNKPYVTGYQNRKKLISVVYTLK